MSICKIKNFPGMIPRYTEAQEDWNWHRGSPRYTWLGHHFQGQKVKGQLAGFGAYYGGLPHSFLETQQSNQIRKYISELRQSSR